MPFRCKARSSSFFVVPMKAEHKLVFEKSDMKYRDVYRRKICAAFLGGQGMGILPSEASSFVLWRFLSLEAGVYCYLFIGAVRKTKKEAYIF